MQAREQRMTIQQPNSFRTGPDERGHFGIYGGRFVAETLMPLILELEQAYAAAKDRSALPARSWTATSSIMSAGRARSISPSGMTEHLGGAKIYFKRDELNHTGAHKINNVLGQILLARRMGKPRIIAETGAGHARRRDRHHLRALRPALRRLHGRGRHRAAEAERACACELLGAEVRAGAVRHRQTLKDAMNEALRDWVTNVADTFYCIGTVAGPHPIR